jgi:hypothetical protein
MLLTTTERLAVIFVVSGYVRCCFKFDLIYHTRLQVYDLLTSTIATATPLMITAPSFNTTAGPHVPTPAMAPTTTIADRKSMASKPATPDTLSFLDLPPEIRNHGLLISKPGILRLFNTQWPTSSPRLSTITNCYVGFRMALR